MTEQELSQYIHERYPLENARCEWKDYSNLKNTFKGEARKDIVSYVSAIANMNGGELIIGIEDKTFKITGIENLSGYTYQSATLKLTEFCANLSSEGLLIEEYITSDTQKRVWIIHIPKHLPRRPVYAHSTAWQRIEDSIVKMTKEREEAILNEPLTSEDWSAAIIEDATIDDLEPSAIAKAKEKYKEVYPSKTKEVDEIWDTPTFLNKAKITIKGKITNTAIILLGKPESEHYLSPNVCKIRWSQRKDSDPNNQNINFRIFTIPMILAIEELGQSIQNTSYTYTIGGSMFPETMMRYDVFTLREPINNAIAHQDYSKKAHIEVVKYIYEKLIIRNHGQFIPQSVEEVLMNDCPESEYRNPFLAEAMRNVKMIETEGGGIKKLFEQQRKRFFPMPEYDLSGGKVKVEIQGNVLDENFAKILVNNPNLTLQDIVLLDKVQKHKNLTEEQIAYLRKNKYIEGRKNNLYLSASVVKTSKHIGLQSDYIKNKSFNDKYYKDLILDYIKNFGKATRQEIEQLVKDKLSQTLSEQQKTDKITNLLAALRKEKKIKNLHRAWFLVK